MSAQHHRKCAAFGFRGGECNHRCAEIQKAIDVFNFNPPFDDFYGHKTAHVARFPILALDCDYEISSVSGVQGKSL